MKKTKSETAPRRLFWGLMIGLGLAFLILVARHDKETIAGLGLDEFSALVVKVALLVFLGGSALMLFRHRLGAAPPTPRCTTPTRPSGSGWWSTCTRSRPASPRVGIRGAVAQSVRAEDS